MKTPIEKLLEIITLKEKENAIYLMPIIDKIDIDKLISEEKQLLIHSVVVPKGTLCDHKWVDARNIAVQSGKVCVKCHNLKA